MDIIQDIRKAELSYRGVVMTVGSFDGVHLGHRLILNRVIAEAREIGGTACVLTMRPHPRQFFSPANAPNILTPDEKKFELLEQAGIDAVFILNFDAATAAIEPVDFIRDILSGRCHAKAIIVGHDCRFGRGAKGDIGLLRSEATKYGFKAEEVPPLIIDAERVSSTLIRERILQGDLERAERFLGRKYSIVGQVEHGRGIGARIGFPTANVKPHHSAVPAQGVYIAEVLVRGERRPSAVNIGIAPTIRQEDLTIEAHILDFSDDIAGERIEIVFHRRIRPERKFPSKEALTEQIARDVEAARDFFRKRLE